MMYNSDTELLFPLRVIPSLESLRGEEWREFIQRLSSPNTPQNEQVAFVLMMVRMAGCAACNADSFRAMRGCTQCARQNIKRFKGSDRDLMELFSQSIKEVDTFQRKRAASAEK